MNSYVRMIINKVTSYGNELAGEDWEGGEDEGDGAHFTSLCSCGRWIA